MSAPTSYFKQIKNKVLGIPHMLYKAKSNTVPNVDYYDEKFKKLGKYANSQTFGYYYGKTFYDDMDTNPAVQNLTLYFNPLQYPHDKFPDLYYSSTEYDEGDAGVLINEKGGKKRGSKKNKKRLSRKNKNRRTIKK